MAAATFMTDLTEIATQIAEAAAGLGSFIAGLKNIELARKYYNLYNSQRQFYYNVFQAGAEAKLASAAYSEPYYPLNYISRVNTILDPVTGPLGAPISDVAGWVNRHAAMYAKTMDGEITELPVDMARLKSDWANYLFRFEELWADVRNDDRWAHRLTVHNIAVKQGAVLETALSGAVRNYTDQMADLSSQLATYGNGIAKYAGYKRGLNDTADYFNTGTKFLPMKQPNMSMPDIDASYAIDQSRGMV